MIYFLCAKLGFSIAIHLLFIFLFLLHLLMNHLVLGIQVVLARSSTVITPTDIDPIAWLACLQVFFFLLQAITVGFSLYNKL